MRHTPASGGSRLVTPGFVSTLTGWPPDVVRDLALPILSDEPFIRSIRDDGQLHLQLDDLLAIQAELAARGIGTPEFLEMLGYGSEGGGR